ncbi:MAG TPA: hypothetical protein VFU06_09465 [Longimicrobiales bacterium]|nr:hypothetical protein [Longimicrobiales bacterium]
MRRSSTPVVVLAVTALSVLAACDAPGDVTSPELPPQAVFARFALALELPAPGDFVYPIAADDANPYFPLIVGTVWTYEAEADEGLERTIDTVTGDTRTIAGITATVLRDEVYLDGDLVELTFDWFGQDRWGNVWYLGEASCEYEPGEYTRDFDPDVAGDCEASGGDPAGSWEAGADILGIGSVAEAGIIMWADPLARKGKTYRQEFYEGEAEDMAKVLHGGLTVTTAAGTYTDCIETMDFTPLEPGAREHKFYCAGVGMVLEEQPKNGLVRNELVSFEPGTP